MKPINIYLTDTEKIKLKQLQIKYQVSMSTICEGVLFYLTKYLLHDNRKELLNELCTKSFYKDKGNKKTSIKPNPKFTKHIDVETLTYCGLLDKEQLNKAYINAIKIYLHKDIKLYLSQEKAQMFYEELNKKLQTTNEPNWNYNEFKRNMYKYERE